MNFSSYIKTILLLLILVLISIASINLTVDPQKIYTSFFSKNNINMLQDYVKSLEESKYGIINKFDELNERDRKKGLAMYAEQKQCAIIGSSHIMQISSYTGKNALANYCESLINLGVSGGTLEDYIAFTNILLEREWEINNKTIVFGIDPWALNFNRDSRWGIFSKEVDKMYTKLKLVKKYSHSYKTSLLINLINLEYLQESLKEAWIENLAFNNQNLDTKEDNLVEIKNYSFVHADKFDLEIGIEGEVTLPDGSHSYAKEYLENQFQAMKDFDGANYANQHKLESSEVYYEANAIKILKEMVLLIQKNGGNVIFVLTPYHQNTFMTQQQIPKTLDIVERKIHDIAKSLKVTLIGSYRAENIPCSNNEFIDFAHASPSCLLKLTNYIR